AAVGGIQRQQRTGIKVVAWTVVAVPVWSWVSRHPIERAQLRIVRAGEPRRSSAGLPAVLAAPRLAAGLTGSGNRVTPPDALAGLRVVGVDESANARLGARHADDDLAVDGERRESEVVAESDVVDVIVPVDHGGIGIQRVTRGC